ncbi:serine/threonine-protein kinase [Dactylosporangium sp. CA-152071]|uniref:serine/threonine-protein kinase n=1 Tax=Dactylosporangium sp. CA-152071 TaxID=3239933 RepID=UPI003D94AF5B
MSYGRPTDAPRLRHPQAAMIRCRADSPYGDSVVVAQRLLGDRYRVEWELGRGGMGTVWRGHDLRLDRPIAVKVLSGEGLGLPKAMERFGREARAVARLSHPNVVPVYDFGAQDGEPYLVMELVEGPTVADLMAEGPLSVADVLAISSQICDGLTAAHTAKIVHRDIKPSNLIVTATGVVKICDFGVSRMLNATEYADLTGSAIAMGSPKYMAPEQINGEPVDARTDLYGLGCSMYAMLIGHPPFSTGSPLSVVQQHVTTTPEPLRVRRPDVPAGVEALVADLLAKTPDERPPDATTVRKRMVAAADRMAHGASGAIPRSAVSSAADLAAAPPRSARSAEERTPLPAPRSRRWLLWVAAAVAAAAVTLTALIATMPLTNRSGSHRGVQRLATDSPAAVNTSPSVALTSAAPTTARAQTQPAATESAPPPPPPTPTDPIVAMHQIIQEQVDAGFLKADAAGALNHMIDDLAKSMANARPDDEAKKLKALRDKLAGLYKEGKLTDSAYTALNSQLDAVAAEVG